MSAHERERLSAYLDDELPPAERTSVASHLAGCAECRGQLAWLAAVDAAAAGLPADAPEGYFDGFARRVRERLEERPLADAAPVARARAGRRLPPWTWAVAAALVFAVVTPLTWREHNAQRRAERTSATGPAMTPTPAREVAANASLETAPATVPETRLESREGRAVPLADAPTPGLQAPVRSDAPRRQAENVSPGAGAPAPPAPAPAIAPAPAPAVAALAAPAQGAEPARRAAPQPALEEKAEAADAAAPAMASGAISAAQRLDAGGGQATDAVASGRSAALGRAKAAAPASVEAEASSSVEFRRLASQSAVRVEEWRALRERWRLFVAGHPDDAHADEARVRVIACGLEAVRAGGGEADRTTLARDADLYLARADASQRSRVRALVEAAASR